MASLKHMQTYNQNNSNYAVYFWLLTFRDENNMDVFGRSKRPNVLTLKQVF